MANIFTTNPIKIDTVMGSVAAGSLAFTAPIKVHKVEWVSPVAVGDAVTIIDANSNILFADTAATAGGTITRDFAQHPLYLTNPQGWRVSVLSSGTLYIYFTV